MAIGWHEMFPWSDGGVDRTFTDVCVARDDIAYIFITLNSQRLWKSDDGGRTIKEIRPLGDTNQNWWFIKCSGNGKYVLVTEGTAPYHLYLSTDYGETFNEIFPVANSTTMWMGLAISRDGSHMHVDNTVHAYISADYGATWNPTTSPTNASYWACDFSNDGQYGLRSHQNGENPQRTANYGVDWATTASTEISAKGDTGYTDSWNGVSVSKSGQYMMLTRDNGYIYLSNDYGVTWTNPTTSPFNAAAIWSACMIGDDAGVTMTIACDGVYGTSNANLWIYRSEISYWGANPDTTHWWRGLAIEPGVVHGTTVTKRFFAANDRLQYYGELYETGFLTSVDNP
jgi:photosystem II stability/assembly factor-like uncharacterized protein